MLDGKKYSNLAEREGFEPSVPVTQYARLAIWCLRPLGHLSARAVRKSDSSTSIAAAQATDLPRDWRICANAAGAYSSRIRSANWGERTEPDEV